MKPIRRLSAPAAVLLAALVTAGCSGGGGEDAARGPDHPYNVVIIVADAMRQDVVGCYGGIADTPNIDWIAAHGVRFENAYSTSPWTSPSAVSMFTGNYATSYAYSLEGRTKPNPAQAVDETVHVPEIYVPDDEYTLMEALAQSGYDNAALIENINASLHNNLQGLDSIPQGPPSEAIADSINRITGGTLARSWEWPAYQQAFCVLRHLFLLPEEQPFVAVHWILDPHSPYDPPPVFAGRIQVDESQLPAPREYYSKTRYSREGLSPAENRFIRDLYVAEVESVDERVGMILAMLQYRGLRENTIVVLTADHGEQFGAHGLYEHGGHGLGCHYYEGLMRVPLVIGGPGLPAGITVDEPVTLLGLMPTLKEFLGMHYEDDMQGKSYVPLLTGESRDAPLYFDDVQDHEQVDALLEGGYKLIATKSGNHELYALDIDPGETVNLAPRTPGRVADMMAVIERFRAENAERQKDNLKALGDELPQMSDAERREVLKKLRALGYVQ